MPRLPAEDRLGRLLAIVPWVVGHEGPELSEVCRRFGVDEEELLADLQLLFMCGVHPFTPDVLIDVDVRDGRVWIRMADYFRRPLKLAPQEALALLSAGRALLAVPGADSHGALATAVAKLETLLGVAASDALDVELGDAPAGVLDTVRKAAEDHRKVEIDYYSFGRDGHATRVVQPWRVFNSGGHWYARGWCELAVGERLFRVDRMSQARMLEETFDPPSGSDGSLSIFDAGPEEPLVVLDLNPAAHWVASEYPNEGVESRPGDVLRVRLRSNRQAWLERLLLRGGGDVRVVDGDVDMGPAAAARILTRYQAPGDLR